jgi:nucleoside-diphosphate-sugar epimerase
MRALVIGCGYVGTALAKELARAGHTVTGLSRNPKPELQSAGIGFVSADITRPETLIDLRPSWEWVVQCVSSGGGTVEDYQRVYHDGTLHVLAWLEKNRPLRFLYTSSTGVYGQNDGEWVAEDSPANPGTGSGKVLLSTENLLQAAYQTAGFPAVILRVAGIYGPGRRRLVQQFLYGETREETDQERWMNMIHRDDVVAAIVAGLERGRPGEIYNAVDDHPVTQRDFFEWMSQQTGKPSPPIGYAQVATTKRRATNKQISNHKIKSELGFDFRFPSFREGYADVVAECRKVETP